MKIRHIIPTLILTGFLLGIHDGYIALWKDGNPTPQVYPYRAELLPRADQQRLQNGIRINSRDELIRLVEDFMS